ncbi:MAG: GNAT family N-acetyltransferase [Aristaeellaceae bacterium]
MLRLYQPTYHDLWFRQSMMADEETMSYNHAWGGTIPFPEEKWRGWYDRWIGNDDGKRFYRYVTREDGVFVGEIAYHDDDELDGYVANVIIHAKFRGMGFGGQALELLCAAAKENGIAVLYDDIALDNPAIDLFARHGFREKYRTDEIVLLMKSL